MNRPMKVKVIEDGLGLLALIKFIGSYLDPGLNLCFKTTPLDLWGVLKHKTR
jgi:hypothetical protein